MIVTTGININISCRCQGLKASLISHQDSAAALVKLAELAES